MTPWNPIAHANPQCTRPALGFQFQMPGLSRRTLSDRGTRDGEEKRRFRGPASDRSWSSGAAATTLRACAGWCPSYPEKKGVPGTGGGKTESDRLRRSEKSPRSRRVPHFASPATLRGRLPRSASLAPKKLTVGVASPRALPLTMVVGRTRNHRQGRRPAPSAGSGQALAMPPRFL
jgi:hypothetical protein